MKLHFLRNVRKIGPRALKSISGQTHKFIIYAIRQRARYKWTSVFLCVCPVIDNEFRHTIVKRAVDPRGYLSPRGHGLVQSLNSPFFPLHIGAEPWRAKEESRITCMRMLRTPPFFPPKSGEKPYLEVLSRFGLWRDFLNDNIQAISAFRLIKNMSINPRSVEFHQCHAKPHSICFFITLSKVTKEIFVKIC